jgi:hypothetical protein
VNVCVAGVAFVAPTTMLSVDGMTSPLVIWPSTKPVCRSGDGTEMVTFVFDSVIGLPKCGAGDASLEIVMVNVCG